MHLIVVGIDLLAQCEHSGLLTSLTHASAHWASEQMWQGWSLRLAVLSVPCHITTPTPHTPLPPFFPPLFTFFHFYFFATPPKKRKKKNIIKKKESKFSGTHLKVAGAILPETKNFSECLEKLLITSSLT